MPSERSYQAVVEKVIPGGQHGPYAVGRSEELGSVTFSLDGKVWQEEDWPEPGMYVVLTKIRKKRAGWRANRGRFVKPADEQPSTQHQKGVASNE